MLLLVFLTVSRLSFEKAVVLQLIFFVRPVNRTLQSNRLEINVWTSGSFSAKGQTFAMFKMEVCCI